MQLPRKAANGSAAPNDVVAAAVALWARTLVLNLPSTLEYAGGLHIYKLRMCNRNKSMIWVMRVAFKQTLIKSFILDLLDKSFGKHYNITKIKIMS